MSAARSAFTLGMLGPVTVAEFRDFLYPGSWRDDLPAGLGGTPVNLLCRELLRRGHRLVVFTLDPAVRDEVVLDGDRLRLCIGPFRRIRARDFFREEVRYLRRAVARERPDILHAQWTYEYALAAQASGIPHVITAHDAPINIVRHNLIPYRIARTLMAYRVIARARRVVSVSPYIARHLRRAMLYRGTDTVIPNGLPERLFEMQRATRAGDGITYATVLNGWGPLKNGRSALEAFARVRARRRSDRLVMFGLEHGRGEAAERFARGHGIDDGVEFVGSVPHPKLLARLAADVDVLVHPSVEESQSMALLEAMALGIPGIGGEHSGGVPWTLDDGRAGILVDVASPEAIADAMLRLASDAGERGTCGRRGREHAARRFHVRTVADAYEQEYLRIAGRA